MSGPFGSSQWMYSSGGFYPYEIEQSLRFNDDDSAYLSRTPASAGNRKTWTWSGWVKRGNLGGTQALFQGGTSALTSAIYFRFTTNHQLQLIDGPALLNVQTAAVFRDPSAWLHIVLAFDTTQATASNRVRLYINGELQTSLSASSYPSLDASGYHVNNTNSHQIAAQLTGPTNFFDGYMAEVNFIDGQALDPTAFGQFKSGVWVPKRYTGTYGTNGFYLPFSDSAAIGDDLSGNGNDWTPVNLASTDVLLDSPTNNWATLSAISGTNTLSDGNLRAASGGGTQPATFLLQSGKWYWEAKGDRYSAAICGPDGQNYSATISNTGSKGLGWFQTGPIWWDGGTTSPSGTSYTTADILGIALDMDAGTITFYKNNVFYTTLTFGSGTVPSFSEGVFPAINGGGVTTGVHNLNFGQDSSFAGAVTRQGNTDANGRGDFYYAPPAGHLALCTANLPDPVINPAVDDVPADYFNTVLYTGNASTQSITGVGFQPDLTWIKGRSGATDHGLYDAVRGVQLQLESNTTAAETTETTGLTAFGTDGFTVGALAQLNTSSATYVAWNWLAGNGTASNTDGSITSTVSVNQKAGFSIVSYTGTGANATVGHGLGVAPKMIIVKDRDAAQDWVVYHAANTAEPETDRLLLNSTGATVDNNAVWNDTAPTSSVFSVGTSIGTNPSGNDLIAYCFAEVEGYSKFGSYTGNGSADGPFVWCGFRPAFVMVKRTDSAGDWVMKTGDIPGYNEVKNTLTANTSNAEATNNLQIDFIASGFKWRDNGGNGNTSGGTYIFAAFAEMPVKYSGTMAR
jgi:hypothetical protein